MMAPSPLHHQEQPHQPSRPPQPLYLIRFTQTHIDFRTAELATLETLLNAPSHSNAGVKLKPRKSSEVSSKSDDKQGSRSSKLEQLWRQGRRIKVDVVRYEMGSPFCVVAFRVVRTEKRRVNRSDRNEVLRGLGTNALGWNPAVAAGMVDTSGATQASREEGITGFHEDTAGANDASAKAGTTGTNNTAEGRSLQQQEPPVRSRDMTEAGAANGDVEGAGPSAKEIATEAARGGEEYVREEIEVECEEESWDEQLLEEIAREYISRSVQAKGIYEVWGHATADGRGIDSGTSAPATANDPSMPPLYADLHESTRTLSSYRWPPYQTSPDLKFKLSVDSFNHARSAPEQRDIINSFAYLDFSGLVRMKDFNQEWVVFEEWLGPPKTSLEPSYGGQETSDVATVSQYQPLYENTYRRLGHLWFTRAISTKTLRPLIDKHDLKKRPYISTTSMDAELALVTANLALAGPGKMFLDPFCGTGGFLVAAAELGAWVVGSDIDGRSFRGKGDRGLEGGVGKNVKKYELQSKMGGCFTGDLVNSPLMVDRDSEGGRGQRWLDGIIADPPYGVREGLKVLGARKPHDEVEGEGRKAHLIDGVPAHTLPGYVAPKKPYSFERMLDDVLEFAWRTLVDGGRLAFWMPSANENEQGEEEETMIPQHPGMELLHVCVQRFNRWSRRLLVYQRRPGDSVHATVAKAESGIRGRNNGKGRADDLNPFRRRYFQAFAVADESSVDGQGR